MSGYKSLGVGDTAYGPISGRVMGRVLAIEGDSIWIVEPSRPDRAIPFSFSQVRGERAFHSGLFRLKLDPAGYGYEVRWFDRDPGEKWIRVE